ncbi:Caleosin domain-containing protein [Venturia nashicola]|uniref:Caleosin-domain-containing protein n=1 Tax=Venturia nashicola TaxID=86259 RepID=A0A4Z1PF04_9PEZI|nr:Caleosin-domain-containing protein [Venturia nashicola]TLD39312.1 Caleosin domain-containing protein [Venturia nashicola]
MTSVEVATVPQTKEIDLIPEAPVTVKRKSYIPGPNDLLTDAGAPRATIAASKESPNGTVEGGWAANHQHQTVLQQHVSYWDTDNDGIISPLDTYLGVRAWGWSKFLALVVVLIIHPPFSYPTVPGLLPDPYFRIYLRNIHKDKHGSSTMTYDTEGRFRPQIFEDIFAKYDHGEKGGLDLWDVLRMMSGYRLLMDTFGLSAVAFEWLATYLLLWPEDGVMKKDEIRRVYDGSIFQYKADEYARKSGKNVVSVKMLT